MYLKLHLTPEAKRDLVTRVGANKFAVQVREKAVGNLANKRALNILAEHLKMPPANIRIMSGHHTPHKIIFIRQ